MPLTPGDPTRQSSACPSCGQAIPSGGDCPRCATAIIKTTEATIAGDVSQGQMDGLARVASYRILRQLGAGGMGTVYLAHDEKMNRDVALKVMSRHQAPSEKAGKRFEHEAWIAGRLDHPNLVKVYERGTWEELSYFSMEYVDGGSLADVVGNLRLRGRDDRWNLDFGSTRYIHWAMRKVIEAARGLDYAHRQGVVHRDVKPLNLLLSRELDAVKIADFGLAIDAKVTRMTTAGTVMGTLAFMAPEQIRGQQERIDARTDVYSLGVTLFELLTLELPYSGKTQQLYMSQVLSGEARRASKLNARVSRDLETVLRKALETEPQDRYRMAGEFADDLENVLNLRPIQAQPTGQVRRTLKWIRRRPVHAALIATLALSLPSFAVVAARTIQHRSAVRQGLIDDLLGEARWLEERRRYDEVLDRVAQITEIDEENLLALRYGAMARFELSRQRRDAADALQGQALEQISQVIERRPQSSWPHALKAYMLHELQRQKEALAEEALAARFRADPPSDEDLGEEARLAHSRMDYTRAVELFSELIRRRPDFVTAISSRALAYEELHDPESAFVDYRVAVGLDPEAELVFNDLARMSVDRGRLKDADRYLEHALRLKPDSALAHEIRGQLLLALGKEAVVQGETARAQRLFEQAEAASQRALQLGGRLKWAHINLATSLVERNRLLSEPDPNLLARAIEQYRRELDSWNVPPEKGQEREVYYAALANSCDAQIQLNRLEEALGTCSRVTVVFPENPVGFYNLAGVYGLLGRQEEALAALERDLELGDSDWEYLAADKWFAGLRKHPRFVSLVDEMHRRATSKPRA